MSKIADKIAAFAPTSGTNVMGASKAQRPVPIIHPHGTNDDVLQYSQVEGFLKNYRDQFNCPAQAKEETNYPNAENNGATMYTWGPCDKGVYIKHLKLPGRGHSPSKADVSDIWNFVKEWTVDGKIGETTTTPESSDSPASSADAPKSSSSGTGVAQSSSSRGFGFGGRSSSGTGVGSSGGTQSPWGSIPTVSSSSIGGGTVVGSSSSIGGGIVIGSSGSIDALVADPSLLAVSVYRSSDNSIMVSGAQGKSITVFNSLGHVVGTTRGTAGAQKVYTGAKGVYIVKVGSRTFKTSL